MAKKASISTKFTISWPAADVGFTLMNVACAMLLCILVSLWVPTRVHVIRTHMRISLDLMQLLNRYMIVPFTIQPYQ